MFLVTIGYRCVSITKQTLGHRRSHFCQPDLRFGVEEMETMTPSMPAVSIEDTPTEPATTCPLKIHRQNQLQLRECQKFQFSDGLTNFNFPRWSMVQGRRGFASRHILNDGTMTQGST